MHTLEALTRVLNLVYAGLLAWVWVYLLRLERTGCKCAVDYKRTYIMTFLAVRIIMLLAMNLVGWTVPALGIAMAPADVVFVVFALQYVHSLKQQKCTCSQDAARDVLQIVAIVDVVIAALVMLLIIKMAIAFKGVVVRDPEHGLLGAVSSAAGGLRKRGGRGGR